MSKYDLLWKYVAASTDDTLKLTFDDIDRIAKVPLDHSFLNYKKELNEFGWNVKKINMKEKNVYFERNKQL